jgi:GntR family transcriptional regulator
MQSLNREDLFKTWKINRKNGGPLYLQIELFLQELIRRPEFANGGLLPDEVTLADRLGVSRGTVRNSLMKLVRQGYLNRKAGVGTRVAKRGVESGIVAWTSLTREMARKGIQVQTFLLEVRDERVNEQIAAALHIPADTMVKCLDQVRGWHDAPVLNSRSWFHPRLGLSGKEDFSRPLYQVLKEDAGVDVDHAHEEFLAVIADARTADLLKLGKVTPLLLRRRTTFDAGERPIEFAEIHYRNDNFSLTLDLRVSSSSEIGHSS